MENDTQTGRENNESQRYFSLFEYHDSIIKDVTDETVDDQSYRQVYTCRTDETVDDQSYSLTVVCSDVPSSLEVELRKLLAQKLTKNAVYFDVGSVTQFDLSIEEKIETWSCYYCMIQGKEIREDGGNIKYIVCFVAPETEMLEIFTHDLDIYCQDLSTEINKNKDVRTVGKFYLEKWHELILGFLCRCVQLLQQDIKYLLYCALIDGSLKINGGQESVSSDLTRFVKLCNMSDIFGNESTGSTDMLVDVSSATETVTMTIHNDIPQFDKTKCTKFCEHWSKAINSVDTNSPGEIRQAVEAFKVKFIHSINTMKRLLMEAQNDYYAYYRAYKFLQSSQNSEILLNHAHLDDICEVKDVFRDLKKYMSSSLS